MSPCSIVMLRKLSTLCNQNQNTWISRPVATLMPSPTHGTEADRSWPPPSRQRKVNWACPTLRRTARSWTSQALSGQTQAPMCVRHATTRESLTTPSLSTSSVSDTCQSYLLLSSKIVSDTCESYFFFLLRLWLTPVNHVCFLPRLWVTPVNRIFFFLPRLWVTPVIHVFFPPRL